MSGNTIGSVIGLAVGFMLAPTGAGLLWASRGMSIGGVIGGLLMPDEVGLQDQYGPKLNDLKVTSSTYGLPINRIYGTYRVGGNTIWAKDIKEVKHVEEVEVGKGGSETYDVTTYSYSIDMAIALCEGPVVGVRKIWADSVLIYDTNATTAFYNSTEQGSGPLDIFLGTDDQIIDWYMQSFDSNTPAYRNICYIRFNTLQLEKFGNRVPNITAEVVMEGTNSVASFKIREVFDVYGYVADTGGAPFSCYINNIRLEKSSSRVKMINFDGSTTYSSTWVWGGSNTAFAENYITNNNTLPIMLNSDQIMFESLGDINLDSIDDGISSCTRTPFYAMAVCPNHKNDIGYFTVATTGYWKYIHYYEKYDNTFNWHAIIDTYNPTGDNGLHYTSLYPSLSNNPNNNTYVFYKDNFYIRHVGTFYNLGVIYKGKGQKDYPIITGYSGWYKWNSASYFYFGQPGSLDSVIGSSVFAIERPIAMDVNYDKIYIITTKVDSPKDIVHLYTYTLDGEQLTNVDITNDFKGNGISTSVLAEDVYLKVENSYIHLIDFTTANEINYIKYTEDNSGNKIVSRYYDTNYDIPILSDLVPLDYMFRNGLLKYYNATGLAVSTITRDWTINLGYISNRVTLQTITDSLCSRSGLIPSNYNNSEGSNIDVYGFNIANISSARSSLAMLQSVFLFDLVEENFQIKLKIRDVIPTYSILESELINNTFQLTNQLDTELPKKITLAYSNNERDYLTSSQSTMRIEGNSDNNISLSLPLVLTDTEAKQLSEKIMYSSWSGQTTIVFQMALNTNLKLSQVIYVTNDNITYLVRIVKLNNTVDKKLEITSVIDNASNYISYAIGEDTSAGFIPSIPEVPNYTFFEIFNAPTLSNSIINDFGIYYIAGGSHISWKGCEFFKSKNDGNTYGSIGIVLYSLAIGIGKTNTPLPNITSTVWDLDNTITVIMQTGEPQQSTEYAILNGLENHILVGNEVIQYVDINEIYNNTFILSKLLRGRRGTEWATSKHTIDEKVIFLNSEIQFNPSTINVERSYAVAEFGSFLDLSLSKEETYDGTNLKPFSPSYLKVIGNDISWVRRDRYIPGPFNTLNTLPNSEQQEKYKVEFFYLDVSQGSEEVTDFTTYTYSSSTYPDIDKIQVSQYSDNLLEYGYISEIII